MKPVSAWALAASLAIPLLAASPALADVVGPNAEGCVDGSVGDSCHGGPFCSLDICTTDADCDGGEVCKDTDLCTTTIDCGGMGGPFPVTEVTGHCDDECPSGSTCTPQKVCVASSSGPGGTGGNGAGGNGTGGGNDVLVTGCACDLAGRNTALGAAGALLFAAGLAGLGGRRRRRR